MTASLRDNDFSLSDYQLSRFLEAVACSITRLAPKSTTICRPGDCPSYRVITALALQWSGSLPGGESARVSPSRQWKRRTAGWGRRPQGELVCGEPRRSCQPAATTVTAKGRTIQPPPHQRGTRTRKGQPEQNTQQH